MRFVDRHRSPPDHFQTLHRARGIDGGLRGGAVVIVVEVEVRGDNTDPRRLDHFPELVSSDAGKEPCRKRREDPCAVAGDPVGSDRAAVPYARKASQRQFHDLAADVACGRRHESDAAGVDLGTRAARGVGVTGASPRSQIVEHVGSSPQVGRGGTRSEA